MQNHHESRLQGDTQVGSLSPLSIYHRGTVHLLSVFSSVCLTIFIVFLVGLIPVSTDVSQYKDLLMPDIFKRLAPEPLEMPQYALTVFLLPCLYLAFHSLFKRISAEKERLNFALALTLDVLLLIAAVGVGIYGVETAINFNFTFLPVGALLAVFIIVAWHMENRQYGRLSGEALGKVFFFLIFAASLILGFYLTYRVNHMLQDSANSMHHFYAWWYPVYKVGSGMTIGVDFDCLYGFYPYFIVPVLKLLGGVNQHSFSIYLSVILSLISICYFVFSYKFINSKLLAGIVGFAASFYGPFFSDYMAWHPSRTLFHALVLVGIAIDSSLKGNGKSIFRVFMALLLGLGIAWNIEMGFVAAVSWAGYLIYLTAAENGLFDKKTIASIAKAILLSVLSAVVAVAFIELVTYHRTARFIGRDSILFGQTVFAGMGFHLVKITFDTWMFVAIPMAAGLFAALPFITKKGSVVGFSKQNTAALFAITLISIGSFSMFMGRSVPSNSLAYLNYDAMICGVLVELYAHRAAFAKQNGVDVKLRLLEKVKVFLSVLFVALVSMWAVNNVLNCFSEEYYEDHLKTEISSEVVYSTAQSIKDWSEENGLSAMPHLLISQSCYVNEALARPSSERVCEQMDWFYKENAYTYIEFIQTHPNDGFVIDEIALNRLTEIYPDDLANSLSSFHLSQKIPAKSLNQDDILLYAYLPNTVQHD